MMTDTQTGILLKIYAKRLESIEQEIKGNLPASCAEIKTVKPMIKLKKDAPDSYEITTFPILDDLKDFIEELKSDAEVLKASGLR